MRTAERHYSRRQRIDMKIATIGMGAAIGLVIAIAVIVFLAGGSYRVATHAPAVPSPITQPAPGS